MSVEDVKFVVHRINNLKMLLFFTGTGTWSCLHSLTSHYTRTVRGKHAIEGEALPPSYPLTPLHTHAKTQMLRYTHTSIRAGLESILILHLNLQLS